MQGALKYFTDIDDPRSPRNQKHPLFMLIGTTLLASLAGIDSFSGFADFREAHYEKTWRRLQNANELCKIKPATGVNFGNYSLLKIYSQNCGENLFLN